MATDTYLQLCQQLMLDAGISGTMSTVVSQSGELGRVTNWINTATKEVENHVSCIHHLVGAGAQINSEKKGRTILMVAASKGYIELISEILSKDAWVNNVDSDSRIALHYAIDNKAENLDVVNLLIEHGSDVN